MANEPVATDADSANNYDVANGISTFQAAAKAVTDMLANKSSEYEKLSDIMHKYREAVTLAYVAALNGDIEQVVSELAKVVNN